MKAKMNHRSLLILVICVPVIILLSSGLPKANFLTKAGQYDPNVAGGRISVCSFNIRYSNDQDGANNWMHRKQWVADYIHFFEVDIVGTQEVQLDQQEDLTKLLPEYKHVGAPSDEIKTNGTYEFCAIYYRPDKVKLLDSGDFWLSDTPSTSSKGWDAIYHRVVSWGKFEDLTSGSVFYFFNTHFSHVGENARTNSARVMREMISQIAGDQPVIATGDFNARPETKTYQTMTQGNLYDAAKRAESYYGPNYTFNCFGNCELEDGRIIDYIFVSDQVKVNSFMVLTEQRGDLYISDHYPLIAKVSLSD